MGYIKDRYRGWLPQEWEATCKFIRYNCTAREQDELSGCKSRYELLVKLEELKQWQPPKY